MQLGVIGQIVVAHGDATETEPLSPFGFFRSIASVLKALDVAHATLADASGRR